MRWLFFSTVSRSNWNLGCCEGKFESGLATEAFKHQPLWKKSFILLPCLGYYFSRFVTEVGSLLFRFISKGSFIHVGLQQVTTILEISVSEAFIFSWLQGLRCNEENKKQNKNYCLFYQCVNFWKHWITKGILGFNNSCRLRFPWWIKR